MAPRLSKITQPTWPYSGQRLFNLCGVRAVPLRTTLRAPDLSNEWKRGYVPLKVAFDHQIFSMQRYGGVSRYFVELASRLPSETVSEVSVIAPVHINSYLTVNSARGFTHGRYIPFEFKGVARVAELINRLAAPLAWSRSNADVVHETYYSIEPVGKAHRRVVTVHDMIYELFAPKAAERWIAAKRAAVHRADHVVCVSENTRSDLVHLYNIDPERTSVVHHGYSLSSGTFESNNQKIPSRGQRPSLLYVGNRRGYKNFATLLKAYSNSPILREFNLIAFGGSPCLPEECEEIERLGITDRVRFESGSDRALAERYREATAFVYPSLYEGFGIPPLEAMSHGCPVVCSNAGSIPEVVGDAGVYFDPTNSEELRSTLEAVATDEGLQASLRMRGYQRISEFSWDRCAEATAGIYRDIM
jgi:glycosyltransferase involved in cell wall biosynthesis